MADSAAPPVPARRAGAVRRPNRPADRGARVPSSPQGPAPSWSASTSSRSTGRCRSTPTSPAGPRTPSACSTSPRRPPRPATTSSRPCCSRRATWARRSSTRRPSAAPTSLIAGPAVSAAGSAATSRSARTIPYVLKNAPCAVWVIARGHARGARMKAVIVGCGRVGAALADELDRAGHAGPDHRHLDGRLRPAAGLVRGHRHPRRRHGRGRPAAGRRRGRRPVPRPDRGRQPERHGGAARHRGARCRRSRRQDQRPGARRGVRATWASRRCAGPT